MQKMYSSSRIILIFVVIAFVLTVYVSALYNVQVYQPRQYAGDDLQKRIITRTSVITSARGNIYDRNGVLLASGRPSHNVRLDWPALRGMPETNDVVLELIYATIDAGYTYSDTFPITRWAPFEYQSGMTATQRNRLDVYLEYFKLSPDISVADLLSWFRDHYKIDYTVGILDARLIIGVRYEMEIRAIIGSITPYIFASDVSTEFISYLAERGLAGVYTETTYIREYHTNNASHLLGYIGLMTTEEYNHYKELGYPMTAQVGKNGVEYAFEEYLHGSEGQRTIMYNEEGTVLRDEITIMPKPGSHVYLTIDLDLQIAAENALRSNIEAINAERRDKYDPDNEDDELELIPAGAVVVVNAKTGEVLACVSYPGFNISTLSQDWLFLNNDPSNPMFNRATHGRYSPGSTFKMVTALAGLRNINFLSRYYTIDDSGPFDKYYNVEGDFIASCWHFRQTRVGHGPVDMVQAIECSCNYYFLQLADWLYETNGSTDIAAELLDEASLAFGLGMKTGLELPEFSGQLANREVKLRVRPDEPYWVVGDLLMAGFGQGVHRFTPLQLANYAATIGNGGTLNSLSLLRRVMSPDFADIIVEQTPKIISQIEDTDNLAIIQEGMRAVVTGRRGTARDYFLNYRIPVAAKTGTVQSESQKMNDGVFVCYAPANDPEIAIAVVVEKGGSGSESAPVARMIMDRYFVTESSFQAVPYGQMIP